MVVEYRDNKLEFHEDGTLPDNISRWIFVFGSNTAGRHGAGAAKIAVEKFGAILGRPAGLQGRSFAIPTLDRNFNKRHLTFIDSDVVMFKAFANMYPELKFWMTAIGCGLAGYDHADIAPMFRKPPFPIGEQLRTPTNVSYPEPWKEYLT